MTLHCNLVPIMTSQCATIHDLYACLNIFTFALQYSSPCLSCTCHSCNSSFLLGGGYLPSKLCNLGAFGRGSSQQYSRDGAGGFVVGLCSLCACFKKGVKSKRLIQGHNTGEEGQGQLVKRGPAFLANTWQRWILHSSGCARYGGPAAAAFCKDAWKI